MTEGQMFKPRTRFMSAALSAALVVGMAPSFALIAPHEAYAGEGAALTPAAVTMSEDADAEVQSCVSSVTEDVAGNYVGGVQIVIASDSHDVSMADEGDTVVLNGVTFDYSVSSSTTDSNKFTVQGYTSPYTLCLTSEATNALVSGENTLVVNVADEDCGEFTVKFNVEDESEAKAVDVDWGASFWNKDDQNYLGFKGVTLAPSAAGTQIPSEYRDAITSLSVNGTAYAKASNSTPDTAAQYSVGAFGIIVGDSKLKSGENEVVIEADGYEDVTLTVTYDASAQTASLKAEEEQESKDIAESWAVSYGKDTYNTFVQLKPATGSLAFGLADAITSVKVNETAYAITPEYNYGMMDDSNWQIENGAIQLSLNGFEDGENTIVIEADGYNDVELTVDYDASAKTVVIQTLDTVIARAEKAVFGHATADQWKALQAALVSAKSLGEDVTDEQVSEQMDALRTALKAVKDANAAAADANPTAAGDYSLKLTAYNESSFKYNYDKDKGEYTYDTAKNPSVFRGMSGFFGTSYRLTRTEEGAMTLTLRYASTIDMQKITLDGVEATKTGVGPKNVDGTYSAFLFEMPISDLNADHFLSFSYDTGNAEYGVKTSSVYLVDMSTAVWSGYSNVAAELGSAATAYAKGEYQVPVTLMHATEDRASMAASGFDSHATLTVAEDGTATMKVGTKGISMGSVTGYPNNVKIYQGASTDSETVDATAVESTEVTYEGETVKVPTVLEFTVPAAAASTDYVYLSLEALGVPQMGTQNARLKIDYANLWSADKEAADAVVALISALPASSKLALTDKAVVTKAQSAYDALTDEQKALVTNSSTLTAAVKKIETLEKNAYTEAHTLKIVTVSGSYTYTGSKITPSITVKAKDGSTIAAKNYTVSYKNNTNAGKATITVKGKGDFTGEVSKEFTIAKASIKDAKVTLKAASAVYNGKTQSGAVQSVVLNKKKLNSKTDYTVSVKSGKKVGSYTVTVAGAGNYKGSATATYKITQAAAKVSATTSKTLEAKNLKSKAATFKAITPTTDGKVTYTVTKADPKKKLTFKNGTVTVKKGTAKGTYKLTVKVSAKAGTNYKALAAKTYTITVKVK